MKYYLEILLASLLSLLPIIPEFGVVDIVGIHYLYILIIQSIIFIYLLKFRHGYLRKYNLISNKVFIAFLAFIFFSAISIINSFNKQESIIELFYFLSILLSLHNLSILLKFLPKKFFFILITSLLFLESTKIFLIFLEKYSYLNPPERLREFQGFAYNQNVAAFSLLIKIPLVIYSYLKSNSRIIKILLLIILNISLFDILIIGSRGAILMTFIILILLLNVFVFRSFFESFSKKKTLQLSFIYVSFIFTFFTQNLLYKNNSELQNINRVTNYQDASVNYRFNNYREAFEMISDFPFFGIGIGNYKILSLKYAKDRIIQYEVPYHTHNDFLQIWTETGLLGFISYLLIFFIPLLYFFRCILFKTNKKQNLLFYFLILSVLVYMGDAFVNFPKARTYSQMNFIYVFAFIINVLPNNHFTIKKHVSYISSILIFLFVSFYISINIFESFREQKPLIFDFNDNPSDLKLSIDFVDNIKTNLPNISKVVYAIDHFKANYFLQEGDLKKAIKHVKLGDSHNPFLGVGEHIMSQIYYYHEKNLDSAYKYSKISNEKLPLNNAHASMLQIILNEMNLHEESKKVFLRIKSNKEEQTWKNFIVHNSIYKRKNNIKFDDFDKSIVNQAKELFPKTSFFKQADKYITLEIDEIGLANSLDFDANQYYKNNEFEKAIYNWQRAIEVIPNDDAYYLNIAQCYINMELWDKANEALIKIEEKGLKELDGKFEFLKGLFYLGKGKTIQSCKFLNKALQNGYQNQNLIPTLTALGCV